METKTIRGRLVPSNSEAATCPFVRVRLYWSFTENGLREIVTKESKWDDNGINFNSVTPVTGEDLTKFITALEAVMKTEDAIRLGLSGSFTIMLETGGTMKTFSVTVENGKVSYEETIPLKAA